MPPAVNGAPTRPIGNVDAPGGISGISGWGDEWETVPDLQFPQSVYTYARMRRDPKLSSILAAYFLPLLRATWSVDPEGVDRTEAVDLVSSQMGLPVLGEKGRPRDPEIPGFKWHEHLRLALLQYVYGFFPFERWFDTSGRVSKLAGVAERQPHTIATIDIADDGHIVNVEQNTQTTPIPARRLLWYVHQREGANWTGVSLLRPCYTAWLLKHETLRVHATSIRRFGMGVPTVTAPAGGTPAQVQEAQRLAAGYRAGDQAGAGLPSGFTFELAGLTGSVPDAVAFLGYLDQQMTGSALTGLLELGSTNYGPRALGDTFFDLFTLSLQAAADAVGDTVSIGDPGMPGLVRDLVEVNWGEGEPVPRIVAGDVGDRHEVTAAAIQQLIVSGAVQPDDELEAFIRDAWSLPARKTPRAEAPPKSPPPGAGPPEPTPGAEPGPGGGPGPAGGGGPGLPPSSPAAPPPGAPATPRAATRPDGLRRDLTPVEAAAGLDPQGMRHDLELARDRVMAAWVPVLAAQRADLADQVSAAVDDGHLDRLAQISAPSTDAGEVLYRAMTAVAAKATGRMIAEAAGQGVTIDPAKVKVDHKRLKQLAQARAAMAAGQLAQAASRRALQVVTASAGTEAAREVTATLVGLSTTSLADELMAALHAASNEARFAVLDAGPDAEYVSSEINDANCCEPCRTIDGYQFTSLAEARADYANGGYVKCLGGLRCRGTVVATWHAKAEEPPEEPDLSGPLGRYLGPSSWRDVGLAGTAAEEVHEPGSRPFAGPDAARFDPLKHPRDSKGRFARKGTMTPGRLPWEHSWQHVNASEIQPGNFVGTYEVTSVEHGSKPHTVRVIFKGGARVTFRDTYRVTVSRESYGGESFFSENKTLHKDDPAIRGLVSVHKDRLHVAEDGKGWDTSAVQGLLRGLQEVPASHQRFLARSHVEIWVGTENVTKQDSMDYLAPQHPAGYPEGDTYDQCGALFRWPEYDTTRKPEFGKTYNPPMTAPGKIILGDTVGSGSVNASAHETGHALDSFLGEDAFFRGAGRLSVTGEFTAIYKRFAARNLEGHTSREWLGDPYYLQDADKAGQFGPFNRGASEFFAETYAAWVHTAGRPSKFRAEEIMDAVGFTLTPGPRADPALRRKVLAAKKQMGQDLITFYDGLDARIKGAVKRLPPPRMKTGTA